MPSEIWPINLFDAAKCQICMWKPLHLADARTRGNRSFYTVVKSAVFLPILLNDRAES